MSSKWDTKDVDEFDEVQGRDNSSAKNNQVATTTIRIAPPSVSEKNDRRAVRDRTRRRRPRKLRIDDDRDDGTTGSSTAENDIAKRRFIYEPDIASFVSGCIPGVSIATAVTEGGISSPSIRRRSLPLLSFLSSTHLAAAEKKRKEVDREKRNSMAEEEARKALLLNPIVPTGGGQVETTQLGVVETPPPPSNEGTRAAMTSTTTIAIEGKSNILMPPLLRDFLREIRK
ncbi:hypothetical protein ACHAXA_006611 [Cyclostephanos tholiformis]|uniref:Uncharacterized protein n=1 Tax=Cyclostephanos tholiformis TaxID=382380 RepID=A0ABD3RYR6_9STRA